MTKKTLILSLIIVVLALAGTALAYFGLRPEPGQNQSTNGSASPEAIQEGTVDTNQNKSIDITDLPEYKSQEDPKNFFIYEVGVNISFPNGYSLIKNSEQNRRGSFLSYDFQESGKHETPLLYEIQFFSEDSIRNFTDNCNDSLCFFGDYPDLDRYFGQKVAFSENKDYQDFELRKFGSHHWFISNISCYGDDCTIREYTTFLGDTKVDIWVIMNNFEEEKQADVLFTQLKIE